MRGVAALHSQDESWCRLEGLRGHYGKVVNHLDTMDGKQPGDPGRGAQAILAAVDSNTPPVHLLLGSDALRRARERLDNVIEEIDRWEAVTRSTDFPQGA